MQQPPDQSSEEIQDPASLQFYEFPSEAALPDAPLAEEQGQAVHQPLDPAAQPERPEHHAPQSHPEEAIRQGLVYPPPPSFYQNMPIPAKEAYTEVPPRPINPQPYPVGPTSYASVQAPPSIAPAQLAPKKSRRWIWIVVATMSVALLAGCGLCSWGAYNIFVPAYQQANGSLNAVTGYYSAIQAKNYESAYSYLAPSGSISGLTLAQFTQQAQSADSQYGPVLSYTPQPVVSLSDPNNPPSLSRLTLTVNVGRSSKSYTVLLTTSQVGNSWKIVDFDKI